MKHTSLIMKQTMQLVSDIYNELYINEYYGNGSKDTTDYQIKALNLFMEMLGFNKKVSVNGKISYVGFDAVTDKSLFLSLEQAVSIYNDMNKISLNNSIIKDGWEIMLPHTLTKLNRHNFQLFTFIVDNASSTRVIERISLQYHKKTKSIKAQNNKIAIRKSYLVATTA